MTECPLIPWMKTKKLDQDGVAALLRAPQSAVGAYIRGERGFRLHRFVELSKVTGIELEKLITWTVQQKSASKRRPRTGSRKSAAS